ncbi:hypothetical protein HYW54_00530 [Candidatus Gottesmanbacteria bacterium]|nr:hypothetical protein [Candidatus Gottesmanbacteria bacterium]
MKKGSLLLLVVLLTFSLFVFEVNALTLEEVGNAAGSQNSINVNQSSQTNVNQNSNTNLENQIDANANTGGNSASNNQGDASIKTGDASVNITVNNKTGKNKADICCEPTEKPKPTKPGPTTPPGGPTATPKPGNGGNGGPGPGNGGVGGPPGQVMGIAAASNGTDKYILYGLGLVCLGIGMFLGKTPGKSLAS